jgi:regulator of nonsense transcripts 3
MDICLLMEKVSCTLPLVVPFHNASFGLMICDVGNEYRAVVEFSPFQKIPKEHKPADSRQGTIESG